MKKILLLIIAIVSFCFIGCEKKEEYNYDVSIITPSGTPLFALNDIIGKYENLEIVTDTTLLQTALIKREVDIVICPLTMGTNLYLNGKSSYKLETIITSNNTYLVSNSPIDETILLDKTIVGFNENNTPGIILKTYIESNNLNDKVTLQFEANVNQSTQAFMTNKCEFALVSEPQLTQIESKKDNVYVLDLAKEINVEFMPQAAIFVNPNSINDRDVKKVLETIQNNVNTIENGDIEQYAKSLSELDVTLFKTLGYDTILKALPRCNVCYFKGAQNQEAIVKFYDLCDKYANIFKGNRPNEEFYNK